MPPKLHSTNTCFSGSFELKTLVIHAAWHNFSWIIFMCSTCGASGCQWWKQKKRLAYNSNSSHSPQTLSNWSMHNHGLGEYSHTPQPRLPGPGNPPTSDPMGLVYFTWFYSQQWIVFSYIRIRCKPNFQYYHKLCKESDSEKKLCSATDLAVWCSFLVMKLPIFIIFLEIFIMVLEGQVHSY